MNNNDTLLISRAYKKDKKELMNNNDDNTLLISRAYKKHTTTDE